MREEEIKLAKKYDKLIIANRPWGADMLPSEAEAKAVRINALPVS